MLIAMLGVSTSLATNRAAGAPPAPELSTADTRVSLSASGPQPHLVSISRTAGLSLRNRTAEPTPEQHEAARQAIDLYKNELRPLIRDARLYHVSPRPDGVHWDGIEYWDPQHARGVVFAFRGGVIDQPEHRFTLAGLDAAKHYRLHFQDGSAPDRSATGTELMNQRFAGPLAESTEFRTHISER